MKVIGVVSAVSREGKTSLSAQLAISLARTVGEPVLLIDTDMRSPDLHAVFSVTKEPGLAELLAQGCNAQEAIRSVAAHPMLSLLPAGRLRRNPHNLVGRGSFKAMVDQFRDQYRYIVIDTPPVLSASEALVAAKATDGVLICTLRDSSRAGQVRLTYERLLNAGARVIGVVLSGVPTKTYAYKYGEYAYSNFRS